MDERRRRYRTIDLARAAGVHPNTVRLYETWGFLACAERGANGYRSWTQDHLDQMVFARRALHGGWPGRRIRVSVLALVRLAAAGDLENALGRAREHAQLVREERSQAEAAAAFLERWASGSDAAGGEAAPTRLTPREAAAAVGASGGQIRNWERNRLVDTPRDPRTGRRYYRSSEIGRLRVIRILLLAGYSVTAVLRIATELDCGTTTGLRDVLETPRCGEEVLTSFDRWLTALAEQEARAGELVALLETRAARRRRHPIS